MAADHRVMLDPLAGCPGMAVATKLGRRWPPGWLPSAHVRATGRPESGDHNDPISSRIQFLLHVVPPIGPGIPRNRRVYPGDARVDLSDDRDDQRDDRCGERKRGKHDQRARRGLREA